MFGDEEYTVLVKKIWVIGYAKLYGRPEITTAGLNRISTVKFRHLARSFSSFLVYFTAMSVVQNRPTQLLITG